MQPNDPWLQSAGPYAHPRVVGLRPRVKGGEPGAARSICADRGGSGGGLGEGALHGGRGVGLILA